MKNITYKGACLVLSLLFVLSSYTDAKAELGDMGFFGGITEGKRLPKTTEILLAESSKKASKNAAQTMTYKEVLFLSGKPVEFEGQVSIKTSAKKEGEPVGTYTVTYDIEPSETTNPEASLTRNIVFTVNYREVGNQVIKDYEVKTWKEEATVGETVYEVVPKQSFFGVSILEDHTPGVVYYKGNLSKRAVYLSEDGKVTAESSGDIYGYESAWSNTETHRVNTGIFTDGWQMQYQERPSVSVNKTLQYSKNEPVAISFSGNYREVMQNQSGLLYDIFIKPQQFYDVESTGKAAVNTFNSFEQLIAPDLEYLKGHFAESDIKKLFAMQILSGGGQFYKPEQAMTRGEFVTALVKAVKLPIEVQEKKKTASGASRKKEEVNIINVIFPDVTPDRAEYPYIMAAYKEGLAIGRSNGNFFIDAPIERQEALVLIL
ncbi:MAG: S-layer homology domain-containing protein, partial [Clostridiales bacterium]|nr:S-layer homology domain-containing protein [Clostridiales bacterium]